MNRLELMTQARAVALKPTARAVVLEIAAHWNDDTEMARIGARQIAERIGRGEQAVRRAINQLCEAGIIVKVRTKRDTIYKSGSKISSLNRVNGVVKNDQSWRSVKKGLNPEWRQILPEYAHMTDEEVAEEFRKVTVAAQLADQTGWTMDECMSLHPDWVQAQISTVRECGPTGSRFLEWCPAEESTEGKGERYTKNWEYALGF